MLLSIIAGVIFFLLEKSLDKDKLSEYHSISYIFLLSEPLNALSYLALLTAFSPMI